ncbi:MULTISPECIES: hypothetical protein [Mesorhizobium]|nr:MULTISPECIES: hypothetical protein [Mesorhizobium]
MSAIEISFATSWKQSSPMMTLEVVIARHKRTLRIAAPEWLV